jgi:2-hydroxychromene-2-carboxylate isomerase
MTTIDYFLTLNSPWTFLGAERFRGHVVRHGARVNVKPARFAEVFSQTGGLPLPKRAPERQRYRLMELKRWREYLGIPIVIEPRHFPSDEVAATRLLIAAAMAGADALAFSHELGRIVWEREESLADAAAIEAAAVRAHVDLARVKASAPADAELDAIWARNTAEAVERGVFGAPSYVFPDGEIFWGQDRVDFVGRKLAKG